MKKTGKWVLLAAVAIGINACSFSAVAAYLTDADRVLNVMTVGHNTIDILEEFIPPDKLEPGTVIAKKVNIENTGENPCAVRVSAEFTDSDMAAMAELDIDSEFWEYRDDGYYYYKEILDTGDITHTLFNTVSISEEATADQLEDFDIMIYAESRNAENGAAYSAVTW